MHLGGSYSKSINDLTTEGINAFYAFQSENTKHAKWRTADLLNRCTGKTVPGVRILLSPPFQPTIFAYLFGMGGPPRRPSCSENLRNS